MRRENYTIGIVCALPLELAAVRAMLDEVHPGLPKKLGDTNTYSLGRIGKHNVVIACLPDGQYGTNSAASVASQLQASFPLAKLGLMVGIAGGVPFPSGDVEIRLGDVVVSRPTDTHGGVIQYDLVKTNPGDDEPANPTYKIMGHLNHPPEELLTALNDLQAKHMLEEQKITTYLAKAAEIYPRFGRDFGRPSADSDMLFRADYEHVPQRTTMIRERASNETRLVCPQCDSDRIVSREPREDHTPRLHYGIVASGNQLMRHGRTRDKIATNLGALCFEMEAAGLMNKRFIVIRGICDYADSHKHKLWQKYAAATAAAFSKELLETIPIEETAPTQASLETQVQVEIRPVNKIVHDCQKSLYFKDYENRQLGIESADRGTCTWLPQHQTFQEWLQNGQGLLWLKGKPGAGKSTLMKYTLSQKKLDSLRNRDNAVILSFFFDGRGNNLQKSPLGLFRSLLYQMLDESPDCAPELIRTFVKRCREAGLPGQDWDWNRNEMRDFFAAAARKMSESRRVVVFIDALDESGEDEAVKLAAFFHSLITKEDKEDFSIQICFACRHYPIIQYFGLTIVVEQENHKDISAYIRRRIESMNLGSSDLENLIVKSSLGVFQWVALVLDRVEYLKRNGHGLMRLKTEVEKTPPQLELLYKSIFEKVEPEERAQTIKLMQWVCFAYRPLRLEELQIAMRLHEDSRFQTMDDELDADHDGNIIERLKNLSHGVVELQHPEEGSITHDTSYMESQRNYVRFIHQSVKDFFLKDGFKILESGFHSIEEATGLAHHRISGSLLHFIELAVGKGVRISSDLDYLRHSFLEYAVRFWLPHARAAAMCKIPQDDLLIKLGWPSLFVFNSWKDLYAHLGNRTDYLSDKIDYIPRKTTIFHIAARYGLISLLQAVLARIHEIEDTVDAKDGSGRTPFSLAAGYGYEETVTLLMSRSDVDINSTNDRGGSPFFFACVEGHFPVVKALLGKRNIKPDELSHDYNERYYSGITPFLAAAERGHGPIVDLLKNRLDVDVNYNDGESSAVEYAIRRHHVSVLAACLKCGRIETSFKNSLGQDLLYLAISREHTGIVKLVLERNIGQLNGKDINGETPLFLAVSWGLDDIVELLLQKNGIDVNLAGRWGMTPLYRASMLNRSGIVKLLLGVNGIEVDKADSSGITPLLVAIISNAHDATMKILEDWRVNVRLSDNFGRTPLSEAKQSKSWDIVALLEKRFRNNVP